MNNIDEKNNKKYCKFLIDKIVPGKGAWSEPEQAFYCARDGNCASLDCLLDYAVKKCPKYPLYAQMAFIFKG